MVFLRFQADFFENMAVRFLIAVSESDHGLTSGCHCWLDQQCNPMKELLRIAIIVATFQLVFSS